MTEQEKSILLLQDICERLPHGIFVKENRISLDNGPVIYTVDYHPHIHDCKPYLRPMSSLTKEERIEIGKAIQKDRINPSGEINAEGSDNLLLCTVRQSTNLLHWLNAHYFDYRGLIEKGLAIEAPEGMYDN